MFQVLFPKLKSHKPLKMRKTADGETANTLTIEVLTQIRPKY